MTKLDSILQKVTRCPVDKVLLVFALENNDSKALSITPRR